MIALATGALWQPASSRAADWPGFRGPNGLGVSSERDCFPASEPISLEIAWRIPLGPGYSAIAIAEGAACTAYSNGEKDLLACFDPKTGEKRWATEMEPTYKGHDGSHDGPIATPYIHEGRVFMLGANGRLMAASLKNGEIIWSVDLVKDMEIKPPFYGFGASPMMIDGVLVQQIGGKGQQVVALDPATGKKVWSLGDGDIGYQSPIVVDMSSKPVAIAAGMKNLMAFDAKQGKLLWEHDLGGGAGRGMPSMIPVPAGPNRFFLADKGDTSTVIHSKAGGDVPTFEPLWETRSIHTTYNVPVYLNEHLYAYSTRFLTCVDVTTGEPKWRSREPGDGFLSLVDGHLIITTKEGTVDVVRAASDDFHHVASLPVFKDVVWCHPAYSDGRIFTRSQGELACINVVKKKSAPATQLAKAGQVPDSQFGRFIDSLSKTADKKAAIDTYFEKQKTSPIVENDTSVHFFYRGEGTDLALAGDMFGARQEQPMHHVDGTDLFYYSLKTEPDARMNYVFMRDFKTMTDPKNERSTVTTLVNEEMEIAFGAAELPMSWFAMPKWVEPAYLKTKSESASANWQSHELDSEALGKKHKIEVYLPTGYEGSDRKYPTVYIFGGDEAVKHGLLKEALDGICGKTVEPFVAVLVNESTFRQRDKMPKMFGEELIPFIDKTYRTIATADGRAAIGTGFAGTDAWFCALSNPGMVGKLGAQSLFMFDAFSPNLRAMLKTSSEQPMTIYLDWGKYDFRNPHEAWDMGKKNKDLAADLQSKGYRVAGGEVNDGSGWSSWKNRTDRMLSALLAKKSG